MENFHLAGKGCLHEFNTELVFIYIKKTLLLSLETIGISRWGKENFHFIFF